ncbi:hypothetical protein D3C74_448320 [compost metagenome]
MVAGPHLWIVGQASADGQDVGHEASIASSTAVSDLSLAIHSVISVQNDPAPTAAGIMSEPSKRNT